MKHFLRPIIYVNLFILLFCVFVTFLVIWTFQDGSISWVYPSVCIGCLFYQAGIFADIVDNYIQESQILEEMFKPRF